ncbi:MAG: hypothetical protein ACHREM_27915, partial [Polyangiales bacterium]
MIRARRRLVGVVAIAGAISMACGPSARDLDRWQETDDGLIAIVEIVKRSGGDVRLRTDAAMRLVHAIRRQRWVGIDLLVEAVSTLNRQARTPLIGALAPLLVKESMLPRGSDARDPSIAAKDAMVGLLAHDLVDDPRVRDVFRAALRTWVCNSARSNFVSQRYSVASTVRVLGAQGVVGLLADVERDGHIGDLASVVVEVADDAGRARASVDLVTRLRAVGTEAWRAKWRDTIASSQPASEQYRARLLVDIEHDVQRDLLTAIGRVGGASTIAAAIDLATARSIDAGVRRAALDALRARAREMVPSDLDRIVAFAASESLPTKDRDAVVTLLTALANVPALGARLDARIAEGGRVRFVAALAQLPSVEARNLDAFLARALDPSLPFACGDEPSAWAK